MAEEQKPQETKQELIKAAKGLPPMEQFSLRPRNFEEAYRFANLMAESDLLPREFQGKPANVLVAVQLGMELGVSPMQALQNIYVVNGKPAIYGDLLPAIVFASGLLESINEEGNEKEARCTVKRVGHAPITRVFTWEDAERAKAYEHGKVISLSEKQTYRSYPKRMLQMRARAWAIRDMFADVLKGVAIREEAEDIITTATEIHEEEKPFTQPQPLNKEKPEPEPEPEPAKEPAKEPESQPASEAKPATEKPKVGRPKKNEPKTETRSDSPAHPPEVGKGGDSDGADNAEAAKSGGEETAPSDPASPASIEDQILNWIETCPEEEILEDKNFLTEKFNQIPKDKQLDVLRPYNDRRQAVAKRKGE